MTKIENVKVKPNANLPLGTQVERYKKLAAHENKLEITEKALLVSAHKATGADGKTLDPDQKQQAQKALATQRQKLQSEMEKYITYIDTMNQGSSVLPAERKKDFEKAQKEIASFTATDDKKTAEAITAIETEKKLRDEAQETIAKKSDAIKAEIATLQQKTTGQVIDANNKDAIQLQALTNELNSLEKASKNYSQALYTTEELKRLNQVLQADFTATPDDPLGSMDDHLANLLADTKSKLTPEQKDIDALKSLNTQMGQLDPKHVSTNKIAPSASLMTGGFMAVKGVEQSQQLGECPDDLKISLPSHYKPVSTQRLGNYGNRVIVDTGNGQLVSYTRSKIQDNTGKVGYITRQVPVKEVEGAYVIDAQSTQPAMLYFEKDDNSQTFQTAWTPNGDNPLDYDPEKQAKFAYAAREATKGYDAQSPASATPASSASRVNVTMPEPLPAPMMKHQYLQKRVTELTNENNGLRTNDAFALARQEYDTQAKAYEEEQKKRFELAKNYVNANPPSENPDTKVRTKEYMDQGYPEAQARYYAQAEEDAYHASQKDLKEQAEAKRKEDEEKQKLAYQQKLEALAKSGATDYTAILSPQS